MVFVNNKYNEIDDIIFVNYYHRYRKQNGERNPAFDMFSGKILDLKEGKQNAINYFYDFLDKEINPGITICAVPPSNKGTARGSGIGMVGELLARNGRKDGIDFLERVHSIAKLAYGGPRYKSIHEESIRFNALAGSVTGDVVLLVDDVTTTGNSLQVCKEILLQNGAECVKMIAIGQTAEGD